MGAYAEKWWILASIWVEQLNIGNLDVKLNG